MYTEFEATFTDVDKEKMRQLLAASGARLLRPEFLQKRTTFNLPKGHEIEGGWARVRDEGDKITLSLKIINGVSISDQKEIQLIVDNMSQAELLLSNLGCTKKAFQETKRELWELDGVEITIDEWPFLEPFVEVEGNSEAEVKKAAEKIGFDYSSAQFCPVTTLYSQKYGISDDQINNHTPEIIFSGENPFLSNK